jgi:nucleoside-diphosphate-sugar epimerase
LDVLVTGGAGFIGSNLVRCLAAAGDRVRILDNISTGTTENLRDANGVAELIVGDIRDPAAVRQAMEGAEVVFHLAATPAGDSFEDLAAVQAVNVGGTLSVLVAARLTGVRRVVFASSSSVYGGRTMPARCEEKVSVRPTTPGAVSKLSAEEYCRAFTRFHGLETVALRFFNVFGPRQDADHEHAAVVPRFCARMLRGERPVIFGSGRQTRDFTFVANAVQACALAAAAGPDAVGRVFDIGSGFETTIRDLVTMINRELGTQIAPVFVPPRRGEPRGLAAEIAGAERVLGYRPLVTMRQGLVQTLQWLRARRTVRSLAAAE